MHHIQGFSGLRRKVEGTESKSFSVHFLVCKYIFHVFFLVCTAVNMYSYIVFVASLSLLPLSFFLVDSREDGKLLAVLPGKSVGCPLGRG